MRHYTITPTDIESYFVNFATKLFHAPGARTHQRTPQGVRRPVHHGVVTQVAVV